MTAMYRIIQRAIRLALPLRMRLRLSGERQLPTMGAALLVSNHLSPVDPLVIGARLPRPLRIVAKSELLDWPVIGGLAQRCGVVPIQRGEWDLTAFATLQDALRQGQYVLIFPEGTYPVPAQPAAMLQFKTGAAWLAAQTRTVVVPVAVWGSEQLWRPTQRWRLWTRPVVHVRIGAPYAPACPAELTSHAALQSVADEMARHICALLPRRYHGYYAS